MIIHLYVKQHALTGLKYFGKTYNADPHKYVGSGTYWRKHLRKHGADHVQTLDVWSFSDQQECTDFALRFSRDNSIVESIEWANLIEENGLDGGLKGHPQHPNCSQRGRTRSEEAKQRMRDAKLGKKQSPEHIAKRVNKTSGQKRTQEQKDYYKSVRVYSEAEREKRRQNKIGYTPSEETLMKLRRPRPAKTCPHCGVAGGPVMVRWHFDKCKTIRPT